MTNQMEGKHQKVILICDSRGKKLDEDLTEQHNISLKILVYSGARLYQAVKCAEPIVKEYQPDQVYILAGINNLTRMNKRTRVVSVASTELHKSMQQFHDEMNFSYALLKKILNWRAKIVFAPITGMSLQLYNKGDSIQLKAEQELLDQSVIEVNTRIISFNEHMACKTPCTQSIIHRHFRGNYHSSYSRLSEDGCHLTTEVRSFWLRKIIDAIKANC